MEIKEMSEHQHRQWDVFWAHYRFCQFHAHHFIWFCDHTVGRHGYNTVVSSYRQVKPGGWRDCPHEKCVRNWTQVFRLKICCYCTKSTKLLNFICHLYFLYKIFYIIYILHILDLTNHFIKKSQCYSDRNIKSTFLENGIFMFIYDFQKSLWTYSFSRMLLKIHWRWYLSCYLFKKIF